MVCIPLCASILFVLPAGNHTNAISAAPPAGHHRVVLSISAPVNKNHCAFHPSAITIAISACAFQSAQSTHRQSTVAISACVSNIRVSNHSSLCIPPTTSRTCAFYFYTSERKSFFAVHTIANLIAVSVCGFHGVHSIMCFHSVRSACWKPHQCNQCLCVLRLHQKPQSKVCSTCWPSPGCAFYFCTSEQESLCIPPISHHHCSQCWCIPVCAIHPPAIHRCNQCVCVQHLRQKPQITVHSTYHKQILRFLFLYQ